MPAKIRLSRHGKKGFAFYHIIVADSRSPRDGKFIEKIGVYNPNTNPATIDMDFDKALTWLQNGAQPTDTCKAILSYEGVLYKNHLLGGVRKGALTLEVAEQKFATWKEGKLAKIQAKKDSLLTKAQLDKKKRHEAELKAKEALANAIMKKNSPVAQEAASTETSESE